MPDAAEDRKVRPHRMIITGRVLWPAKRSADPGPPPLVRQKGKWHICYVFQVPQEVAANRDTVVCLRARCDQSVSSRGHGQEESWHFVNRELVVDYKCGSPLQENEVGLLVPSGWWLANLVKSFPVPCSAFYIDRAQFEG